MTQNAMLADFDALMNASMDDIDDLPPIGVPPSGNYDMNVTASREKGNSGGEYIKLAFEITNVNEVKEELEAAEVKAGQKFFDMYSPFKKDGTQNEIGMGSLKERLKPFAVHFNETNIGKILELMQGTAIVGTIVRTVDKKDPDNFRFKMKDVTVL